MSKPQPRPLRRCPRCHRTDITTAGDTGRLRRHKGDTSHRGVLLWCPGSGWEPERVPEEVLGE